jgi:hypothetical protein
MVRCQALESTQEAASEAGKRDADFIEHLGLAAWLEREPGSSMLIDEATIGQPEAKNGHSQLVSVLADFVSGDAKGRKK